MALAGVGLARLGSFNVTDDVATGRLVEVLQASGVDDREEINAVYLGGTRMAPRVVAFLDFVAPRLQAFLKART
jgi:DNA-binding transcriptional LysR family regulator